MYACSAAVAHSLHRSRVIGHNSPKLLNELCPHQSTCHFLEFGRSEVVLGVDTVDTYLRRYSWFFAAYLLAIQGPLTDCAPWVVFARPLLPRTVRVIWNLATNGAHPGKTGTTLLTYSYEYDSSLGCIGPPDSEFLAHPRKICSCGSEETYVWPCPLWWGSTFVLILCLTLVKKTGQNRQKWSKRRYRTRMSTMIITVAPSKYNHNLSAKVPDKFDGWFRV